jgi:hypothetical protein
MVTSFLQERVIALESFVERRLSKHDDQLGKLSREVAVNQNELANARKDSSEMKIFLKEILVKLDAVGDKIEASRKESAEKTDATSKELLVKVDDARKELLGMIEAARNKTEAVGKDLADKIEAAHKESADKTDATRKDLLDKVDNVVIFFLNETKSVREGIANEMKFDKLWGSLKNSGGGRAETNRGRGKIGAFFKIDRS